MGDMKQTPHIYCVLPQDFFPNGRCHLDYAELQEKVKQWLQQFEKDVQHLPASVNLEEKSRYLVGFKSNTIEVLDM